MARFLYTQYSFSNGELNPRLLGRTDIKEYFNAAKEITNFVVSKDGGLNQVRGTGFLGSSGPSYDITISDKVVFGINSGVVSMAEVVYGLNEIGDSTPSYHLRDITVTETNLPANIAAFEYGTHITLNDATIITDKSGTVEPLVLRQAAIGGGGTTTERDPAAGEYYNPSNVTRYAWEYRTPLASPPSDQTSLYTGQQAGLPFQVESGEPTQIVVGEWTYFRGTQQVTGNLEIYGYYRERDIVAPPSDIGWVIQPLSEWAKDVGGLPRSTNERALRARPLKNINVDATLFMKYTGTQLQSVGFEPFLPSMVGSYLEISSGSNYGYYRIDSYVDEQTVNATLVEGAGVTTNTNFQTFRMPEWYDGSWPKVVGYFQQRLIFGNTAVSPDTAFVSELGNLVSILQGFEGESPTDATAFKLQPAAREISPIQWIISERYITMGTTTEEFIIQGVDGIFSDSAARITSVSKYGSAGIGLAFRAQSATYFLERDGRTLREMAFSEENGGYVTKNLGFLGPDLESVSRFVYDYPNKRIYAQQSSGIKVCTLDPSVGIAGWSTINTGQNNLLTGVIEVNDRFIISTGVNSVEAILTYNENFSLVDGDKAPVGSNLIQITRVSGSDYKLSNREFYSGPDNTQDAYVFDSTSDTWEVVKIRVASGHAEFTDGDLYVTYDKEIQIVAKGLWSDAYLETVPIQQGSQLGDAQLAFNKVDTVGLRLYKTRQGFEVSTTVTSLEEPTIEGEFTGVKEVHIDGCPEVDHTIIVRNKSALPMAIISISARGTGQEG